MSQSHVRELLCCSCLQHPGTRDLCVYSCMRAHVRLCTCVHLYVCVPVCMCMCARVCVCGA